MTGALLTCPPWIPRRLHSNKSPCMSLDALAHTLASPTNRTRMQDSMTKPQPQINEAHMELAKLCEEMDILRIMLDTAQQQVGLSALRQHGHQGRAPGARGKGGRLG